MTIEDLAKHLEAMYREDKDSLSLEEVGFCTKETREGYFTLLYWSGITGWSQVLFYLPNPQVTIGVMRVDYYSSALEAMCDTSIFPSGLMIYMS